MIRDENLMMSEEQAITETAVSTDILDFGTDGENIGEGNPVKLHTHVDVAFETSNAGTLQISLQDSEDNESWADVIETPAIAATALTKGDEPLVVSVPNDLRRYVRVNYTVANAFTAGKISAFLAM